MRLRERAVHAWPAGDGVMSGRWWCLTPDGLDWAHTLGVRWLARLLRPLSGEQAGRLVDAARLSGHPRPFSIVQPVSVGVVS